MTRAGFRVFVRLRSISMIVAVDGQRSKIWCMESESSSSIGGSDPAGRGLSWSRMMLDQ